MTQQASTPLAWPVMLGHQALLGPDRSLRGVYLQAKPCGPAGGTAFDGLGCLLAGLAACRTPVWLHLDSLPLLMALEALPDSLGLSLRGLGVDACLLAEPALPPLLARARAAGVACVLVAGGSAADATAVPGARAAAGGLFDAAIGTWPHAGLVHWQDQVRSMDALGAAIAKGAACTLGWPVEGGPSKIDVRPHETDLTLLAELMRRVASAEPPARLEAVLDRSPALSFKLLQHVNSAAVGMKVQVLSLRHAVMLVGYQPLRQWLAHLLLQQAASPLTLPLVAAAMRRGYFMQACGQCLGNGPSQGDFLMCGLFSLLDKLFNQPMAALMAQLPIAGPVQDALVHRQGPLAPYLSLAEMVELPVDAARYAAAADAAMLTPAEVSSCVLSSLVQASVFAQDRA